LAHYFHAFIVKTIKQQTQYGTENCWHVIALSKKFTHICSGQLSLLPNGDGKWIPVAVGSRIL